MSRSPRIEYEGAIYHVIQRGNNREYIFNDEIHKGYLIKMIRELKEKIPFNIFAFVLMDNHYHMLLQTLETPLSVIMHRLNNKYSKYYNYKSRRSGHVFGERYKAILVQDKSYLLALVRYVHNNPVKAGMAQSIASYKWSSDVFYRRNMKNIVDISFVLDMLSQDRISAIRQYIEFMDGFDEGDDKDGEGPDTGDSPSAKPSANLNEDRGSCANDSTENNSGKNGSDKNDPAKAPEASEEMPRQQIMEGQEYTQNVKSVGDSDFRARVENKPLLNAPSLEEILRRACVDEDTFKLVKSGSRKRSITQVKVEYIKMARYAGYSYSMIGKELGTSDNAIISMLKRNGIDVF